MTLEQNAHVQCILWLTNCKMLKHGHLFEGMMVDNVCTMTHGFVQMSVVLQEVRTTQKFQGFGSHEMN